jgi:hypothetical protein
VTDITFPTYPKINSLWKRNPKGNLVLPGQFASRAIRDLKDAVWYWAEKIDGMNIRFYWDGARVHLGGRTDNAQFSDHIRNSLMALIDIDAWRAEFGDTHVIVFGEGYGAGIQKGGGYRDTPGFITFDIQMGGHWGINQSCPFIGHGSMSAVAHRLGFDVVKTLDCTTVLDAWDKMENRFYESTYPGHELEGIVGRPEQPFYLREAVRMTPVMCKMKYVDVDQLPPKPTLDGA